LLCRQQPGPQATSTEGKDPLVSKSITIARSNIPNVIGCGQALLDKLAFVRRAISRTQFSLSSPANEIISNLETALPIGQQFWRMLVSMVVEEALDKQLTCSRFEVFKASFELTQTTAMKHCHPLFPMVLTSSSTQPKR
jgi:hypothetical protein